MILDTVQVSDMFNATHVWHTRQGVSFVCACVRTFCLCTRIYMHVAFMCKSYTIVAKQVILSDIMYLCYASKIIAIISLENFEGSDCQDFRGVLLNFENFILEFLSKIKN